MRASFATKITTQSPRRENERVVVEKVVLDVVVKQAGTKEKLKRVVC